MRGIIFFKAGRIFSPGCDIPGLKNNTFSPGLLVPFRKPGVLSFFLVVGDHYWLRRNRPAVVMLVLLYGSGEVIGATGSHGEG